MAAFSGTGPPGFRERRYAETVREIKRTALEQYAAAGAEGLALRAVARRMGLSAQALYHYFGSRDELLAALVADGYSSAADAVAVGRQSGAPGYRNSVIGAAVGYREWAVGNPHLFRLTYGDIIPGYRAPTDGRTIEVARRLGQEFDTACFPDWSPERFDALAARLEPIPAQLMSAQQAPDEFNPMPPVVRMRTAAWWAQLHGLVSLELFGHLGWVGVDPAEISRIAIEDLTDRIQSATDQW